MLILFLNLVYIISTLGLVALGLAISFGLLRVLNMAHGEFLMLGAYSVLITQQLGLPFILAIPISIIISGFIAWIIEKNILSSLYNRPFDTLLATWGISILLRNIIEWQFGKDYQNIKNPLSQTILLGDDVYPLYRLVLMAIIFIVFIALYFWYKKSKVANQLKAMQENPNLAQIVGIKIHHLATLTFIFSAVITTIAGVLLAPLIRVDPHMGLDYLLNSFFVLIVGGLGTLEGLLLGSGVIGSLGNVLENIFDQTFGYAGVLILSILFLWLKPNGLFSNRTS